MPKGTTAAAKKFEPGTSRQLLSNKAKQSEHFKYSILKKYARPSSKSPPRIKGDFLEIKRSGTVTALKTRRSDRRKVL